MALVAVGCSSSPADDAAIAATDADLAGEGVDGDTTESTAEPEPSETSTTTTTTEPEIVIESDYGVTDSTIRIGYSLDLSGPFSARDARILDGHVAFFESVNDQGGIEGREVELVRFDNAFDVPAHLDNIAELIEQSSEGTALIGALSHPNFDDATISAVDDAGILIVGNAPAREETTGDTHLLPLAASICSETVTGVNSMMSEGAGGRTTLAIIAQDEPWAASSADAAREAAAALGIEVVVDIVGVDDIAQVAEQLAASSVSMVWVALSPRQLGTLASVIDGSRNWLWSGPTISFDPTLLDSEVGPALERVYRHVSGSDPIDADSQAARRSAIALALPELTFAEAGPVLLGWEQAEVVNEVLLEAFAQQDATRRSIAMVGAAIDRPLPAPRVFSFDLSAARDTPLSGDGAPGLVEVTNTDDPTELLSNVCGSS